MTSDQLHDHDLIPASMLAAFAYCPRLCYLQFVQGEFQDSAELAEGRFLHRWVDGGQDAVPEDFAPFHARSVSLSAPQAGVCCRIDLLEGDGKSVTPIEYKRGKAQERADGWYDPQMIQLAAQGLALQENGFSCEHGMIYYILSKERVFVSFDPALMGKTKELIEKLGMMVQRGEVPPPLRASARCERCSLAGVCLPDEVNLLAEEKEEERLAGKPEEERVRLLLAKRDDANPVYVIGQGHVVRKRGDRLEVWSYDTGKVSEARIREVSQLCLYGGVEITTPAMLEMMQRNIPVIHFSHGGWFFGICQGNSHRNVELRRRQFSWAEDGARSLSLSREFVSGKIRNCRVILMNRDLQGSSEAIAILDRLAAQAGDAASTKSAESLRGVEGLAAHSYFSRFGSLAKADGGSFSFEGRNRRPPRDPVNAVLSYLYGVLTKELTVTALAAGFDPYLGFYHRPRYGRPALALDLMEEFRPAIADATMLSLFNNRELKANDFIRTGIGISMVPEAKKKVIAAYERRMNDEIKHPIFGYRVSYRRVLELQARLLARVLSGEIERYPAFVLR
jgi:CRISPR-associated protein Cas1